MRWRQPAWLALGITAVGLAGWVAGSGPDGPAARAGGSPESAARRPPRHASGDPGRHLRTHPLPDRSVRIDAATRASFTRLEAALGGRSGVAVAPLGGRGHPIVLGAWRSGVSWSTIKPVVAMAVLGAGITTPAVNRDLERAIIDSDNAAAERLWGQLGPSRVAADRTREVLAGAGDSRTRIEWRAVRPPFTPFGQTVWSLRDQVRAVAGMPCLAAGRRVLELMGRIRPDQRWGLGSSGVPVQFKGGWGPDRSGAYLARQMGIVELQGYRLAVAVANEPADGTFASATRNLTALAQWIARRRWSVGHGRRACSTDGVGSVTAPGSA